MVQADWDGVKWCLVAIFVFITFKFWMFIVLVQGLALLDRTRLIWGSNLCNVLHNHEVLTLILFVFVFVNQQASALDLQELLQWCYVTINLQRFFEIFILPCTSVKLVTSYWSLFSLLKNQCNSNTWPISLAKHTLRSHRWRHFFIAIFQKVWLANDIRKLFILSRGEIFLLHCTIIYLLLNLYHSYNMSCCRNKSRLKIHSVYYSVI